MRMKIGVISATFPEDLRTCVGGNDLRLSLFIDAMKALGDLDMLFFVRSHVGVDPQSVEQMRQRLEAAWEARLELHLCRFGDDPPVANRVQEYLLPAMSIRHLLPYTTGAMQVAAVRRLLAREPDLLFVDHLKSMAPFLLTRQSHPAICFDL